MLSELNNNPNFFGYAKDWINDNPGKAVGVLAGLLLGTFLFTLGLFKTLLVFLFMTIGYFLGRSKDDNISIIDEINRIFKRDTHSNDECTGVEGV